MLSNIAHELIERLRTDEHTRRHFDIKYWEGNNTCGTVGCIAGTAIAMEHKFVSYRAWNQQFLEKLPTESNTAEGARILGIDNHRTAAQLFIPLDMWFQPLTMGNDLFFYLEGNEKPTVDYVKQMRNWARNQTPFDYRLVDPISDRPRPHPDIFTPDACANALEQLDEVPFVDWMRAIKRDREKA